MYSILHSNELSYIHVLYKAQHPERVHVSAGISWKGRTPIVIFDGILNTEGYGIILEKALILSLLTDIFVAVT